MEKSKIELYIEDGNRFKITRKAAAMMGVIGGFFEDETHRDEEPIFVPSVSSKIMEKIITYCEFHSKKEGEERSKQWDADFIQSLDRSKDLKVFLEMTSASNALGIIPLVELCCRHLASLMPSIFQEIVKQSQLNKC